MGPINRRFALVVPLLAFAVFFACASGNENSNGNVVIADEADFRFYLTDDRAALIIENYLGQLASFEIPSVIQGMPVAQIGRRAFHGFRREPKISSVTIPDSVYIIQSEAFAHNILESVTIGNNVAFIGGAAFLDNWLEEVTIPDSVTAIDIRAFSQNRLASINIPGNVVFIGVGAFMHNHLAKVTLSDSVVHIGSSAFAMNRLESITIPDSVTRIEAFAFEDNPLTRISIGAGVEIGGLNAHGEYSPSFERGFDFFYFAHGRRAGIYTYSNGAWSAEFRY